MTVREQLKEMFEAVAEGLRIGLASESGQLSPERARAALLDVDPTETRTGTGPRTEETVAA